MEPRVKPVLRGVFHEVGFFLVLVLSVPLALSADGGKARLAAIVFSACLAACFGASALYHRPTWTPVVRSWLARLDHAGIYLLIAGTYTPFGLLVLSKGWAIPVLAVVYTGAAAAILMKLFWVRSPKVLSALIGLSLGWVGMIAITQLAKVGAAGLTLVLVGGLFYTVGGIVYALKRPDPRPAVLGYHELFHLCTVAAAGCQYAAIAFFVLPRG
jgi:hemolysin III